MIYDRMGQVLTASNNYKLAIDKCNGDEALMKSSICKKAGTNYAVTLEKLGRRDEAINQLDKLRDNFNNEVRVHNNLGIIQKRSGDTQAAMESYKSALKLDPKSFFPNYNIGVLLSLEKDRHEESISYLK